MQTVFFGYGPPQFSAFRIRITVSVMKRGKDRLPGGVRQTERGYIGGKLQDLTAEKLFLADPVTSVGESGLL